LPLTPDNTSTGYAFHLPPPQRNAVGANIGDANLATSLFGALRLHAFPTYVHHGYARAAVTPTRLSTPMADRTENHGNMV